MPPVGEPRSPVFSLGRSAGSQLTEVVRHQGPVLRLARGIRLQFDLEPCRRCLARRMAAQVFGDEFGVVGMDEIGQVETLSMGWCLDCHRNPEPHLRPKEFVTSMDWVPEEDPEVLGRRLREEYDIHPSTNCSTCHR